MYKYDVFISYRRNKFEEPWLKRHFLPTFAYFLDNEFPGERAPSFFFDQDEVDPSIREGQLAGGGGIEPGTAWQRVLEDAIRTSRCMVGLWSLPYFRSRWCQVEWRSFATRRHAPLVVARLHEGRRFPEDARAVQMVDMSDFTMVGNVLADGRLNEPFRDAMRLLAGHVAKRVEAVGEYQDWPLAEPPPPPPPLAVPLPTFGGRDV